MAQNDNGRFFAFSLWEVIISTYQVALEIFEGPLDLLLRLIERQELDITKVSLAVIADQYLGYIALLQDIPAADLADFLVIAAKLLVIKSRALLPEPEDEAEDEREEDVGDELVRQLIEYKRFKEVATRLKDIEEKGLKTYPRIAAPPHMERRLRPGEMSLAELVTAFKVALEAHPPSPPVDEVVSPVVVRIADCIRNISDLVQSQRRVRLSTLIRRARSRLEIVVNFLAILEMVKQQRLLATQEQAFGEIYLQAREPDPDVAVPPTDLSEYGEE